jgi:hypothetical protein
MKHLPLVACFLLILIVFCVLALKQDELNARIRTLEIKAGLGDKWAEKK